MHGKYLVLQVANATVLQVANATVLQVVNATVLQDRQSVESADVEEFQIHRANYQLYADFF